MEQKKHLGLRIDPKLLLEFRQVCAYEGRSANAQIAYLIRRCVEEYKKNSTDKRG